MSQSINLLLPELRARFDWLALRVVCLGGLMMLLLLAGFVQFKSMQVSRLKTTEASLSGQLLGLQQQVASLAQTLGARQRDAGLGAQIVAAREDLAQRREVLAFIRQGKAPQRGGFGEMMQGFSRQVTEGVWLTGFALAHEGIEIRGRLLDPAMLPVYIDRLNDDTAFSGRRFSALEMKGVEKGLDPVSEKSAVLPVDRRIPVGRFTEFTLRTEKAPEPEKKP